MNEFERNRARQALLLRGHLALHPIMEVQVSAICDHEAFSMTPVRQMHAQKSWTKLSLEAGGGHLPSWATTAWAEPQIRLPGEP